MKGKTPVRRCAVYTRKSSEEGLEQDFNSLHAQREACEAFIRSQRGEGWRCRIAHGCFRGRPSCCIGSLGRQTQQCDSSKWTTAAWRLKGRRSSPSCE